MAGKILIDLTDEKLKTPENGDVIEFIRATNPSAHSDVGTRLMDAAKSLDGSAAYCPSWGSCAYVVLHTAGLRIFAIAYGMRGLSFRLPASDSDGVYSTKAGGSATSTMPSSVVRHLSLTISHHTG